MLSALADGWGLFAFLTATSRALAQHRRGPIALSDVLAIIGVALIGVGMWLIMPAAALVIVGALLLVAGLRLG